jgi:hypothetical protein
MDSLRFFALIAFSALAGKLTQRGPSKMTGRGGSMTPLCWISVAKTERKIGIGRETPDAGEEVAGRHFVAQIG